MARAGEGGVGVCIVCSSSSDWGLKGGGRWESIAYLIPRDDRQLFSEIR